MAEAAAAAVFDERRNLWEKFHRWISCVCVVTFDLELGQALEVYTRLYTRHDTIDKATTMRLLVSHQLPASRFS